MNLQTLRQMFLYRLIVLDLPVGLAAPVVAADFNTTSVLYHYDHQCIQIARKLLH